jgi:hypothetical protein
MRVPIKLVHLSNAVNNKSQQAKGIRRKHAEGQNRKSPSNGPAHLRLPKDAALRIVERQRGMPSSIPGLPSD